MDSRGKKSCARREPGVQIVVTLTRLCEESEGCPGRRIKHSTLVRGQEEFYELKRINLVRGNRTSVPLNSQMKRGALAVEGKRQALTLQGLAVGKGNQRKLF